MREIRDVPGLEISEDFEIPGIDHSFATGGSHDLWNTPLVWNDAIHLKEAHAILIAVKHVTRSRANHHRRFLSLSDSMCNVLCISKARSSNRRLLKYVQRISPEMLGAFVNLRLRWIPSEWNVCDAGSRAWEALRGADARGLGDASA